MHLRTALIVLIVLGGVGSVIGTTIERNQGENHKESAAELRSEGAVPSESGGEGEGGAAGGQLGVG